MDLKRFGFFLSRHRRLPARRRPKNQLREKFMSEIALLLSDHLLLILVILGAASIVHGLLGIGFPLVSTPLIALFTDIRTAMLLFLIAILLVVQYALSRVT